MRLVIVLAILAAVVILRPVASAFVILLVLQVVTFLSVSCLASLNEGRI